LNIALQSEKSELERLTRKVSHIANHDGLTGLPNRLLLAELLDTALKRSRRAKKLVAVMYLDLDDFKPINDRYGHRAGDIALVVVSNRLKQLLRASDTVSRVGGDEFVAIVTDLDSKLTASLVAEKLVVSCSQPMDVGGTECRVGVSIGIAFFPDDGGKAEELLRHADDALYQVKRKGKNGFAFYNGNDTRDSETTTLVNPEV
jgi:diguanylate cyclase (GGDEF)-like protein